MCSALLTSQLVNYESACNANNNCTLFVSKTASSSIFGTSQRWGLLLYRVTEFHFLLWGLVVLQASPSLCRFANEMQTKCMSWAFRTHFSCISQKAHECDEGPGTHMHRGVYLQGEPLGTSMCWFSSNIWTIAQVVGILGKDCHGMSSRNFGEKNDLLIVPEIIYWVINHCVRSEEENVLVCTFSLEDS